MEKTKIEIQVSKPFYDLGLEIKSLVSDIADATKDGVQIQDVVTVLMPRISRIGAIKAEIAAIPEEVKAPWDCAKAMLVALEGIEVPFLKAPAPAEPTPAAPAAPAADPVSTPPTT